MAFTRILPAGISTTGTVFLENVTASGIITATTFDGDFGSTSGLAEVSKTISDSPLDVFVYDTTKDSDGGAWRYRTQHTSWYKETLNTATRGSRREFPAVAVIVATATNVTIYDGDDPDLPMWMVFTKSSNGNVHWLGGDSFAPNSSDTIFALNGIIASGIASGAAGRLVWANFVSDEGYNMVHVGKWKFNGGIGTRNDGLSWYQVSSTLALVNRSVNDVAMTVLPSAPIDDATGLPVPTIAVATNGGISVIKDDGSVVDITASGYTATDNKIDFDYLNNLLYLESGGFPQRQPIPSADISRSAAGGRDRVYGGTSSYVPTLLGTSSNIVTNSDGFLSGSTSGLSILDYDSSQSQEMVAYAATSYNTGWMHGDIKGAFLSSTDTTNADGTELITNGDFSSALSGEWFEKVNNEATFTIISGELQIVENNDVDYGIVSQQLTGLTVGKTYRIQVSARATSGTARWFVGPTTGTADFVSVHDTTSSSYVTETDYWTATQTTAYVNLAARYVSGATAYFDNVSVTIAEEDRSINDNPLQVVGTVTKSAVATDADLVAYSGFSASNYLKQSYNADLQFGTGDFCFMAWVNFGSDPTSEQLFSTVPSGTNGGQTGMGFNSTSADGVGFAIYTQGIQSTGRTNVGYTQTVYANTWYHICGVRRSGVAEFYLNAVSGGTSNNNVNITDSNSELFVGKWSNDGPADDSSIALLRISASAPSPEQIKKIYEDEKFLFQENAKCTLYGSSDAVTALAYDEKTELLHVGTSSGRSDFQGLCRINNTTEAVTTAISAYDGSIAQQ